MGHNHNIKRREFLAGMGAVGAGSFLSPSERLINSIAKSFLNRAEAATLDANPRNYVNVLLMGAPSRAVFDQWIRIADSDPGLIFNPMYATQYTSAGGVANGVQYTTFKYNNVLVPYMFSHSVASGDGSQRPLTDLLNNMLVIRGFGSNLDGHPFNAQQQQAPVGGVSSISGCAADSSKKYFEAIQWPDRGAYLAYTSTEGKALNKIIGNKPLNTLMEGFGPAANKASRLVRERNQEAFDKAAAVLKNHAGKKNFGGKSLGGNVENALALMKKGIGNIDSYWTAAVARYQNVILNSMRAVIPGINDVALISDETSRWSIMLNDASFFNLSKDYDFRTAVSTMAVSYGLAEGFALAEYIVKEDLGTAIEINAQVLPSLTLRRPGASANFIVDATMDMHETGAMPTLLLCTVFFRGLAAGILEFSRAIGQDKWSNTLLQVLSEFARSGRSSGSGSDHGFNQMITSVYSGAITKGPFVVGNVRQDTGAAGYTGSQGYGAPIDGYNQKSIPTPAAAASTVAHLLNLPKNPFENIAAPLVKLDGGVMNVLFPPKVK